MLRLILEGPDNAGKSTLARFLQDHVPHVVYMHPGGAPKDMAAEAKCVEDQASFLLNNEFCILDRTTTISQRVYNPDPTADRYRAEQLRRMQDLGALVVYCRPSTDQMMAVDKFLWKDYDTEEHKQKIIQRQHEFIQRYDEIMRRTAHVAYDFGDLVAAESFRQMCVRGFRGDTTAIHALRNLPNYLTTRRA